MPQSKGRHAHKHLHPHQPPRASNSNAKTKSSNRVVIIAVLFFAFLGLAIGYFINSASVTVMLSSTLLGAAAGFLFGYGIKKSLAGK